MEVSSLTAVYVSNVLALLLLITVAFANPMHFKGAKNEAKILRLMSFFVVTSCIADPIVFALDGHGGFAVTIILYILNSWLFAANMLTALVWVMFVSTHLNTRHSPAMFRTLTVIAMIGIALLVVNLFTPIVFDFTDTNVYFRKALFWLYVTIDVGFMLFSVIVYFQARNRGAFTVFFPIGIFLLPIFAGMIIQSAVYGISIAWACVAIGMTGIVSALQNEQIYRDDLTGVFNRAYIKQIERNIERQPDSTVFGVMIDINGFKKINDVLGHKLGDEALIEAADIFRKSVSNSGLVIRLSGDEFVLLINTDNEEIVIAILNDIRRRMEEFNNKGKAQYKLNVAMGYDRFDLAETDFDNLIRVTDEKMYADKKKFYENHPAFDRRGEARNTFSFDRRNRQE